MYYIRDGLSAKHNSSLASVLGAVFAVLCCLNSLITGNIVQSNAAACTFPSDMRLMSGIILALLVIISLICGTKKIETITSSVIPPLTLLYMVISLYIIMSNAALVPSVFSDIVRSAFNTRSVAGAAAGFTVREAVRFGIIRGIFSNEAGCGTSPTAHACAETKAPSNQACFGIVEVAFDTLVLCTMTAFVLLIAERRYGVIPWHSNCDVSPITLNSFSLLSGGWIYYVMICCIVSLPLRL